MPKKTNLTPDILATVSGLPSSLAAIELSKTLGFHVGKTTVTDARAKQGMKRDTTIPLNPAVDTKSQSKSSFEKKPDGSLLIESSGTIPQTESDVTARMRARGFDPEKYSISYRFSEWQAQTREDGVITMYAARAGAVERPASKSALPTVSYDDLVSVVESHKNEPLVAIPSDVVPNTFIFNFADLQGGKTDFLGGTKETVARFMNSLDHAEALLTAEPAAHIVWADLGDGIENFCNTSSQRQTNDLNLVEQVRLLRRLQVEGLSRLMKHAPITHVSVPSNHAQNRVAFQAPSSTAHDDWGLEVQIQLAETFEFAGVGEDRIKFISPDEHLESVAFNTPDGTRLGFVHGHRSNSQNGLEQWWAGQSLGRQPTHDADILLVGHFHNLSVRSVGKERYIITTPSLDNGSSWFTVSRGSVATAGVLTMRVQGTKFRDLLIV